MNSSLSQEVQAISYRKHYSEETKLAALYAFEKENQFHLFIKDTKLLELHFICGESNGMKKSQSSF